MAFIVAGGLGGMSGGASELGGCGAGRTGASGANVSSPIPGRDEPEPKGGECEREKGESVSVRRWRV